MMMPIIVIVEACERIVSRLNIILLIVKRRDHFCSSFIYWLQLWDRENAFYSDNSTIFITAIVYEYSCFDRERVAEMSIKYFTLKFLLIRNFDFRLVWLTDWNFIFI